MRFLVGTMTGVKDLTVRCNRELGHGGLHRIHIPGAGDKVQVQEWSDFQSFFPRYDLIEQKEG
jgi:hypothetical protein